MGGNQAGARVDRKDDMGYRVPKVRYGRGWRLKHESYIGGRRVNREVPKDQWRVLGFHEGMSREEAHARADQLNARQGEARHETKRMDIVERLKAEATTQAGWLPPQDVEEFEQARLFERLSEAEAERNKIASHWAAARRIMCDLKLDVQDWYDRRHKFYDWFSKHRWSPSYVQKVVNILNRWGQYSARKYEQAFLPIPMPRGREKTRISDAYYDKHPTGLKSRAITPAELEKAKSALEPAHYNWLYLTVWFGLRPEEANYLAKGRHFEIVVIHGVEVLRVYQTKLMSLAREERWKLIPAYRDEQLAGLALIRAGGPFRTPIVKTMKAHFKGQVGQRSGRKGFTDLMLGFGHTIEDISTWLGHTTIDRTWRDYKNRQHLNIKKPA